MGGIWGKEREDWERKREWSQLGRKWGDNRENEGCRVGSEPIRKALSSWERSWGLQDGVMGGIG